MTFDFDKITDRRGTGSYKWEVAENELPMWVADMDFPTAPAVRAAIEKRAAHGIFGYSTVPEEWFSAYADRWERRHGLKMDKDGLIFCTGVIPAISSAVRKLTTPAERVVVITPVYNIFFNSILNNGREVLECPLSFDGKAYSLSLSALEEALSDPQATLLILCNPHNPIGKLWDRKTLLAIGELCKKHNVTVISDEIHCDLTDPGHDYIPFASVSDTCRDISVTCLAPTKAFNIAGLQTAAVYVHEPALRHKLWRALNTDEVAEPNAFAVDAAIAAFTEGEDWLDALREYIKQNKSFAAEYIKESIPELSLTASEATYLLWLDCSRLTESSSDFADKLRQTTGLYLSAGEQYRGNGDRFLRLNIACPRATLKDGLERLKAGVKAYKRSK